MVLTAGDQQTPARRAALDSLCRTYWVPLYAYARYRGLGSADAEDRVQAFFLRLLDRGALDRVTREGGRFRSFLLAAFQHLLTDRHRRDVAVKRGGRRPALSLDIEAGETCYRREPADNDTPERRFERAWALTLLQTVFDRLAAEQAARGRADAFVRLRVCLTGQRSDLPYAALGEELGLSEAAIKVRVHRLRRRYRDLLREEVAHTLARPEEVEDELRNLFEVLST